MQLLLVMSRLKLSDLEYLTPPTCSRDSHKGLAKGLGPILSPTPLLGLESAWGDPGPRGSFKQSLTRGFV